MRIQFLAGAMALLLVACADIFPAPQSPAQAVFEAKAAFLVTLRVAGDYAGLPRCPAQPLCSDAKTVTALRSSAEAARISLDAAQQVVTDPAFKGDALTKASIAASGAVAAFAALIPQQTKGSETP